MPADLASTSEDALGGALDHLTIGVGVFDPEMRLIYANRPFGELRGLPAALCRPGAELSAILRHTGLTGADEGDAEVARGPAELLGTGAREIEQTIASDRRLLVRFAPVSGGGLMLTYSDVTEARRTEQALRENEERYARVAEAVAEGIYDWNIERDELYVSSRLIEIFGFDGVWLTASDWNERVHPDDRAAYASALRACFQQRTRVLSCEYRIRLGNGEYRWVEDHGLPVRNERQRAIRLVGAVSDVTERKLMDQALRDSEQRHALAIEAINEGVYEWDLGSGEIYYSPRVRAVLGLSAEELKTREDWIERIHPDDLPPYRAAMASHLKGESERFECEYRYRHPDGTWHWARQHGLALRDESGRAIRMTGSTGDITEEKQLEIENKRLFEEVQARTHEVSEALEYQTAIGDVLNVISRSPTDVQPVFLAILRSAVRLCDGVYGTAIRFDGELMHLAAGFNHTPEVSQALQQALPMRPHPQLMAGRAILAREVVQVEDALADPDYSQEVARAGGFRSMLAVPLLRGGSPVGAIVVNRGQPGSFSKTQIELLKTFADQAVIAIENTRLFSELEARTRELTQALEYQTATGEVLNVISRSPKDLQPVLDAMLQTAARLGEAEYALLFRLEEDGKYHVAGSNNAAAAYVKHSSEHPLDADRGSLVGRTAVERRVVHLPDCLDDPEYTRLDYQHVGQHRTMLGVPLLRDGVPIGVIALLRNIVKPFTDRQIELVTTFADQAVIAINNVGLFEEVQARTHELTEALEYQTATSEVLSVISRSKFDLQPVLDTLVESAARLCQADCGFIWKLKGDVFELAAVNEIDAEFAKFAFEHPPALDRRTTAGRTVLEKRTIHIPDVQDDADYSWHGGKGQTIGRYRTVLGVPLLREGEPFGCFALLRKTARPFADKEIELVTTFADQAVIAIENVRLFDEVQARTQDLSESLQQQTATADVLKVISRSAFDLQRVFETVAESAVRLCEADKAFIFRYDGELLRAAAAFNASQELRDFVERNPIRPGRHSATARCGLERRTIHIDDVMADPEYTYGAKGVDPIRTVLCVPMLKDDDLLGVILVYHLEVRPFTDKQAALIETFADQAVIAIENVRLLSELRESLRQQTATADVLKVISRSTFDLQTVLRALLESAVQLCEADQGTITRQRDGKFYRAENHGFSEEFRAAVSEVPVEPDRGSAIGRALLEGRVVHIPDVQADPDYTFIEALKLGNFRTILGVPMMKEGVAIGVLSFTRRKPDPFTEKQIELVSTFADQAAIAIENVRLFESVEARTRELARSLEELRFAQDRLIQTEKLASLGQLTAGIAHEIKNPLNFVNNFSAVSVELIDELREALGSASLDDKTRAEIAELTEMLQGNLEKVVQHGKRADSIVKNMLLHSRQSSAEHRPVDINAIVEESLDLAYHGARAERQGFNITLERSFDPAAGEVDLFPQEITRVLLNLISNGFHATTKRGSEAAGAGTYQPTLRAATRSLGDSVEIRIRDNGTGIPPEVKDRMFNPFFTTKPAGEGTGLGLSISHDIVVKQHAGTIEVDTRLGEFTEFRIILPRGAASIAKSGERA